MVASTRLNTVFSKIFRRAMPSHQHNTNFGALSANLVNKSPARAFTSYIASATTYIAQHVLTPSRKQGKIGEIIQSAEELNTPTRHVIPFRAPLNFFGTNYLGIVWDFCCRNKRVNPPAAGYYNHTGGRCRAAPDRGGGCGGLGRRDSPA